MREPRDNAEPAILPSVRWQTAHGSRVGSVAGSLRWLTGSLRCHGALSCPCQDSHAELICAVWPAVGAELRMLLALMHAFA